jgi:hypothetical protein
LSIGSGPTTNYNDKLRPLFFGCNSQTVRFNNSWCASDAGRHEHFSLISKPLAAQSAVLVQIPVAYGDRSVYPPLGISAFAHLLNNLLPSVGGPSTQPLYGLLRARQMLCAPCRLPKILFRRLTLLRKFSKPYAKQLRATLTVGFLRSTPPRTMRGRTPCRKELAKLISENEKMSLCETRRPLLLPSLLLPLSHCTLPRTACSHRNRGAMRAASCATRSNRHRGVGGGRRTRGGVRKGACVRSRAVTIYCDVTMPRLKLQ